MFLLKNKSTCDNILTCPLGALEGSIHDIKNTKK